MLKYDTICTILFVVVAKYLIYSNLTSQWLFFMNALMKRYMFEPIDFM
jgi:hypothetical protein